MDLVVSVQVYVYHYYRCSTQRQRDVCFYFHFHLSIFLHFLYNLHSVHVDTSLTPLQWAFSNEKISINHRKEMFSCCQEDMCLYMAKLIVHIHPIKYIKIKYIFAQPLIKIKLKLFPQPLIYTHNIKSKVNKNPYPSELLIRPAASKQYLLFQTQISCYAIIWVDFTVIK